MMKSDEDSLLTWQGRRLLAKKKDQLLPCGIALMLSYFYGFSKQLNDKICLIGSFLFLCSAHMKSLVPQ